MVSATDFDGFYFLPGDNDEELNLAYFKFDKDEHRGKPIESSDLGDKFHIAFFRTDENGAPFFDEQFEAIFVDPSTYIKNFIGADVYGCMLRKTENSQKWWQEYLERAISTCEKLKNDVKSDENE